MARKVTNLESDSIWLDIRWGATGLWLALFGLALALTLGALWRPRSRRFHGGARAVWAAAMVAFVLMWVAGVALEMMRRTWDAPVLQLLIAIALFSLLIAGVAALVREWFARPEPPKTLAWTFNARRAAWTLSVLCGIGWALGGFVLWPFETTSYRHSEILPFNWLLAWSGAQLAGAAQLVRARPSWQLRVVNPRPATWWLLAFALFLFAIGRTLVAGVVACAFAAFVLRVWGMRSETARLPKWARRLARALPLLVLLGALWWQNETVADWLGRQRLGWTPLWLGAGAAFALWLLLLASGGRFALQVATFENAWARALLLATGVGAGAALMIFGAADALFWSFWPLATLFFALLEPHDHSQRPARRARRSAQSKAQVSAAGRPT